MAEILSNNKEARMRVVLDALFAPQGGLKAEDIETAATVAFNLISCIVERIVFGREEI